MRINLSVLIISLLLTPLLSNAQEDVRVLHRKLKAEIESTYQANELTESEYNKMLEEYQAIAKTIETALMDGHFSRDEKKKIQTKISRSRKRLAKYRSHSDAN